MTEISSLVSHVILPIYYPSRLQTRFQIFIKSIKDNLRPPTNNRMHLRKYSLYLLHSTFVKYSDWNDLLMCVRMKHHKNKETSGCMENPEKKSFKKIVDAKVYKWSSKRRKKNSESKLNRNWLAPKLSFWCILWVSQSTNLAINTAANNE